MYIYIHTASARLQVRNLSPSPLCVDFLHCPGGGFWTERVRLPRGEHSDGHGHPFPGDSAPRLTDQESKPGGRASFFTANKALVLP